MKVRIKTKILLSAFFVMSLSLLISGLVAYNYIAGVLKQKAIEDNKISLELSGQRIKQIQDQVRKTAEYIITDDAVNKLMSETTKGEIEKEYNRKYDLSQILRRFVVLNGLISNAIIVHSDGSIYSNNVSYEEYYKEKINEKWYLDFKAKGKKLGFTDVHSTFIINKEEKVISFIIDYNNNFNNDDANNNVLILDIKYSLIENIYNQSISSSQKIYLINGDNNFIYGSSPTEEKVDFNLIMNNINKGTSLAENKDKIIIADPLDNYGWNQIFIISKDKLFNKIKTIFLYFIVIIIFSLIFILLVMIPIIRNITNPILVLANAMKKVSGGDLNTNIEIKSGDELEVLGEGFNRMTKDLDQYMQDSINNEKMKRKMQVDLLMAQINPHFIYNTLNSVIYLTYANMNTDAIKIIQALINVLQDTVRVGDDSVLDTIEQEINIVKQYLTIQNYRYPEIFDVNITIEEHLEDIVIPKMIIQPIVENALFHGICPSGRHGIITITIQKGNNKLLIIVEDNGVGIDNELAKRIFESSEKRKTSNKTRSIGLRNIKMRMEYLYGTECSIDLVSSIGEGTKVILSIPISS